LSTSVAMDELIADKAAYDRRLNDFTRANSPRLDERRKWVEELSAEQKAELADRTRAFEELRRDPKEKDRLRELAHEISQADDAGKLQHTLVAYGQWLARHSAGEQQQLVDEMRGMSSEEKVEVVSSMVRREDDEAARHLSAEDARTLREEFIKFAQAKRPEALRRLTGRERDRIADPKISSLGQALIVIHALQNDENIEASIDRLISKLSPEANSQWQRVTEGRRDLRRQQLWRWLRDAWPRKGTPQDLEEFFVSEKLSNDERQRLLEMDRRKMEAELERLYLSSELDIDGRLQFFRDSNERRRGPRPEGESPPNDGPRAEGPPRRPGGPPPDGRLGPGGPPEERFDRDRPPGPRGPDGRRPEDRREGPGPGERFRRPPGEGPDGRFAPGQQPPPPPPGPSEEAI
jgi:hypothetical protein